MCEEKEEEQEVDKSKEVRRERLSWLQQGGLAAAAAAAAAAQLKRGREKRDGRARTN